MKLQTFYKIYYKHRIIKANLLLKIYLLFVIPIKYFLNLPYVKKKINLDNYSQDKKFLFEKNLNFLFEFFESDKGEKFINQYNQPIKRDSKLKIQGHNYAKFYDEYFFEKKNKELNILIEDACHAYKDQIISLFMLFPILSSGGIFITEELDFPDTRADMNLNNEKPTLRDILLSIKSGENFENPLISKDQKDYFLKNFDKIFIFKGNHNEIAIIKKK